MQIAKLTVNGIYARAESSEVIPRGITGAQVCVEYADPAWDGLCKTVVFRGSQTRDVVNAGELVTVPSEVVDTAGVDLWVGVCGTDAQGAVMIPTLWAKLGTVWGSACPSGDPSADATLPVWAQLQSIIGNPSELITQNRDNLVEAVNELALKDCSGGTMDPVFLEQQIAAYLAQNPPAAGKDGDDGASAYEIAVDNGFLGTEKEWLEGLQGTDGMDGKNGISPSISVSVISGVNRVTIVDAAGTKSFDVLNGSDGAAGADGMDGYTPVRGTDYWTQEDKNQIVQEVIEALGTPVFGTVDNENTITLSGALEEGVYTLKYENNDGTLTEIGTITVGSGITYTNLADPSSADWIENHRINSSGAITPITEDQRGSQTLVMTNYISTADVREFHYKGIDVTSSLITSGVNYSRFYFYDADKQYIGYYQCSNRLDMDFTVADYDDAVMVCDYSAFASAVSVAQSAAYIRFGGILTDDTVVITANERIL